LPVTLVKVLPQEIIRYKDTSKDGYTAAVIWVGKKTTKKTKRWTDKTDYSTVTEMKVDEDFVKAHEVGKVLDSALLEWLKEVTVVGTSKGKGFAGVIKRHHMHGMPGTHWHKFTRVGWSKGNRKPRRTQKGHPHAGHMWDERITLKHIQVLDVVKKDNEQLLVLKGSLPGAYNGTLRLLID
jgi:large subunit ribosomal protein L3